jgi:hypothetical protein
MGMLQAIQKEKVSGSKKRCVSFVTGIVVRDSSERPLRSKKLAWRLQNIRHPFSKAGKIGLKRGYGDTTDNF